MAKETPTPPSTTNSRIRDNQRRSRARRKAHLEEIEQRLRICQTKGVEASAEIQRAARKVAEENRALRLLLNRHGVGDEEIRLFLRGIGGKGEDGEGAIGELEGLLRSKRPDREDASFREAPRTLLPPAKTEASPVNDEPAARSCCGGRPCFRPESEEEKEAIRIREAGSALQMLSGGSNCIVATEIVSTMTGADPESVRDHFKCNPCDPTDCQVDDSTLRRTLSHYSARAG